MQLIHDKPVIAKDEVFYEGDPVALVAAEDLKTAEKAVSLIEVEYEPLESYDSPADMLREDAPVLHREYPIPRKGNISDEVLIRKGDVKTAFEDADVVVDNWYKTPMLDHAYLEPDCALAEPDPVQGGITIYSPQHAVQLAKKALCGAFNMPQSKIRVISQVVGGGFGGTRANPNAPQRGESLRTSVTISFEEAAFGCEKEISIERVEQCDTCRGTGCEKGTTAEVCPDCRGTGMVQQRRQTPLGYMSTSAPCQRCGGKGKIIHQPCPKCGGKGMIRHRKTIKVSIPAGIDNGQTISLRAQGNAGKNGGPAGDLLIVVSVRPHEIFRREGTSVLCEAPITFTQAVLGAELEIPTIDGKVKYTIPEGTQSGTTFRLKGKGIPGLNGRGRGDQYVTVYIETPRNLNREQKEALKKFSESLGEKNYEEHKSFFGKFKL